MGTGWRWTILGVAVLAAVGLVAGPVVGRAVADEEHPHYPVPYTLGAGAVHAGDDSPPGSNDWDCHPDDDHPNPVVLVHGLGANQADNWQTIAPLLANHGYCVFSLTYGRNPLAPPGLDKIGGVRFLGGAEHVDKYVGMTPLWDGGPAADGVTYTMIMRGTTSWSSPTPAGSCTTATPPTSCSRTAARPTWPSTARWPPTR